MLTALRAAGRLGLEGGAVPDTEECSAAGACMVACPGPARCPFVVDFSGRLELRT